AARRAAARRAAARRAADPPRCRPPRCRPAALPPAALPPAALPARRAAARRAAGRRCSARSGVGAGERRPGTRLAPPRRGGGVMKRLLDTDASWVSLLQRLVLAIVIFPHGAQKLLGWWGGGGF